MNYVYDLSTFKTFWSMFQRSFKIARQGLLDKVINQIYWCSLNIIIFAYVMPQMGLASNFGAFIAVTMAASGAFFVSINCMYGLIFDITSEGSNLHYELTLPVPQWMAFAKYGIENAVQAFIVGSVSLPIGILLLWSQMNITLIGLVKFYGILVVISCFSGFFGLLMVSIIKNIFSSLDNVWTRIVFPMWFLGGFQFSWHTLHSISPTLAYISLLNPLTYALEGCRSAIMFTDSSLNYWHCFFALIFFTFLSAYVGIVKLMRRMDCL